MNTRASGEWSERTGSVSVPRSRLHDNGHQFGARVDHSTCARTSPGEFSEYRSETARSSNSRPVEGRKAVLASRFYPQAQRSFYLAYGKRTLDIILAVVLLIAFAPLMLVIAGWIVLDSPGRAIYSQRRVGYGQRGFTIYKFRSMVFHAHVMLETEPELAAQYATHWKLVRDPRVTQCGRFLRKISLDELPQLFNVLKGDMSIVGPRPYLPHELNNEFGAHAEVITSVKPGMTGLWQVSGRSLLTPSMRIEMDERYARTCEVRLDTLILFKTVKVVARSLGAF